MMRRLRVLAVAGVVLTAALAGCATSGSDISLSAATELGASLGGIRDSLEHGDHAGAARQLADMRRQVVVLLSTGALTKDRAEWIMQSIQGVEAQLDPSATATSAVTTTATPTTTVAPTTVAPTTTVVPTTTTSTTTVAPTTTAKPPKKKKGDNGD